jgi:hypothetical protein
LVKKRSVPSNGLVQNQNSIQRRACRNIEKLAKERQQQVFSFNSETQQVILKENPSKFATIQEKGIDPFKKGTCPFCLGISQLRLFLISTKEGG